MTDLARLGARWSEKLLQRRFVEVQLRDETHRSVRFKPTKTLMTCSRVHRLDLVVVDRRLGAPPETHQEHAQSENDMESFVATGRGRRTAPGSATDGLDTVDRGCLDDLGDAHLCPRFWHRRAIATRHRVGCSEHILDDLDGPSGTCQQKWDTFSPHLV